MNGSIEEVKVSVEVEEIISIIDIFKYKNEKKEANLNLLQTGRIAGELLVQIQNRVTTRNLYDISVDEHNAHMFDTDENQEFEELKSIHDKGIKVSLAIDELIKDIKNRESYIYSGKSEIQKVKVATNYIKERAGLYEYKVAKLNANFAKHVNGYEDRASQVNNKKCGIM